MSRSTPNPSPWAVGAVYLFGLVLVVSPLVDLATTVLPARPGDFTWRYGALGLAAGYLQTPLLGLVLLLAVAYWQERPWVLRVAGAAACVASLALGLVMVVFALDVLQMRGMRAEEVRSAVLAGGILQELKYFLAALVLAPLGIGSWTTASRMRPGSSRAKGDSATLAAPRIVASGRSTA